MNSSESELQEEKQKKPDGFTFTWFIHNFSHFHFPLNVNDFIQSPNFAVDLLGSTKWSLRLYPKGNFFSGFISCYLRRVEHSESCSFTFSIRKSNGTFEKKFEGVYNSGDVINKWKPYLLSHVELNEPGAYLENDTLIISCRMWKEGADLSESGTCCAHTEVKVSKLDYVWNLRDIVIPNTSGYKFNQTAEIPIFISGIPTLKMNVLNEGSLGEDAIHLGINMPEQAKDVFLVVNVHILDENRKIVHSVHGKNFFVCVNKNKIWEFPIISKRVLYLNEKIFMPVDKLTLQCEFAFSGDHEVIRVAYGKIDVPEPNSVSPHLSVADGYELWKENLKQFFKDGKISDVIVHTSNQEYPAHRAILCAQSEVFLAMFENDMKEKKTGIIEIEDLEDDTVTKMLSYLYTNTIEDLDSSAAQKLYYAADRYGIKALLRICSSHLMHNLDTSNVCEILLLADTHQDQELKSCAKDFIQAHVHDIIDSDNWKSLMETNSPLTSEIMQWLLCCKFLIVK